MTETTRRSKKTVKKEVETVPVLVQPADEVAAPSAVIATRKATTKITKAPPTIPSAPQAKVAKHKKQKMIRDSFTMPEIEYAAISELKARCLKSGVSAKKSEVFRAALKSLASLSDLKLTKMISGLDVIKTGRPAKI